MGTRKLEPFGNIWAILKTIIVCDMQHVADSCFLLASNQAVYLCASSGSGQSLSKTCERNKSQTLLQNLVSIAGFFKSQLHPVTLTSCQSFQIIEGICHQIAQVIISLGRAMASFGVLKGASLGSSMLVFAQFSLLITADHQQCFP